MIFNVEVWVTHSDTPLSFDSDIFFSGRWNSIWFWRTREQERKARMSKKKLLFFWTSYVGGWKFSTWNGISGGCFEVHPYLMKVKLHNHMSWSKMLNTKLAMNIAMKFMVILWSLGLIIWRFEFCLISVQGVLR